jgi:geranylgeranyl diphosphate synthase type I
MTHDERLKAYKNAIDKDIAEYSKRLLNDTESEYGAYSRETLESFVSVLSRGGKRLRGVLTMASYEMLGGKDQKMIIQAARAVEMIHAYVLMIDDIADKSATRRGGPSGHKIMQEYHQKNHLKSDGTHFGESMSTQAALIGGYLAEQIIDDLDVTAEIKLAVLKNFHGNLVRTGHGQLRDILNEALPEVTEEDALWTAKYKTAYYTVINPLETGAILTNASEGTQAILREFGLYAGIGFQIADDILGIFGEDGTTGKSSLDDLKEGKITVLMTYALKHASKFQQLELQALLGNPNIIFDDLLNCQKILQDTGAVKHAQESASKYAKNAKNTLHQAKGKLGTELVDFLGYLTDHFVTRVS